MLKLFTLAPEAKPSRRVDDVAAAFYRTAYDVLIFNVACNDFDAERVEPGMICRMAGQGADAIALRHKQWKQIASQKAGSASDENRGGRFRWGMVGQDGLYAFLGNQQASVDHKFARSALKDRAEFSQT